MKNKIFKILGIAFFLFGLFPYIAKAEETTYSVNVKALHNNRALSYVEVMISKNNETITYENTNYNGVATFELTNGTYTAIVGYVSGNYSYYGTEEFTVDNASTDVTVNVDSEMSKEAAKKIYDRTSYFNHVDIRVNGTFTTGTEGNTTTNKITLKNVELLVTDGTKTLINTTFKDNNETYEWRVTRQSVPKTAKVSLIFDIVVDGKTIRENFAYSFEGEDDFIQAIIDCDNNQGLDFIMDPKEITEAIYYSVSYQWSGLPNDLATPPATTNNYLPNSSHTINTHWLKDAYIIDEVNNIMYKFSGWTTYSNETISNKGIDNNETIEVTSDTTIYGVWTSEQLKPTSNYLVIKKIFNGNDNHIPSDFHFKITTPKGNVIEIPYSDFKNGEYRLPIDEEGTLEKPYIIEEHNYNIQGYKYTGAITDTTKRVITDLSAEAGVTFNNTYEKKIGTNIHSYPGFLIEKADYIDGRALNGAIFTLTPTDLTKTPIISMPTNESGYTSFTNIEEGTYILTETTAPAGYHKDNAEHIVTVTLSKTTENVYDETQDAYITVYDYVLSITPTEHYNATSHRLTIYNEKIKTGSLTISKEFGTTSEYNKDNLPANTEIKVTVTGENNYNNTVTLNSTNNWTVTIDNLVQGIYQIKELLENAEIENYNLSVNYNKNNITFTENNLEENVVVTNTYTKKTGSLTVSKEVEVKLDEKDYTTSSYDDVTYDFEVTIGNKKYNISLKAGETKTFDNIPYGTNYSIIENIPENALWTNKNATSVGTINTNLTNISMLNTYNFQSVELNVSKEWTNVENTNIPTSIEVVLYKDGDIYKTIELSKNNNWKYTFTNLTNEYVWSIDEINVPNGYTKEITQEGNNYTIINKYHGVPQTKDESNIFIYLIITLIGLIGTIITTINYKKRYNNI